jgi:hypothetical protein
VSKEILDLLDRKYAFVVEAADDTFLLDLEQLLQFIAGDPIIKDFTHKIVRQFEERIDSYQSTLNRESAEAIEIRNLVVISHPEIDDSRAEFPGDNVMTSGYTASFKMFDDIVKNTVPYREYPLDTDAMDDESKVENLIRILDYKIVTFEGQDKAGGPFREFDEDLKVRIYNLKNWHKHTHQGWVNNTRISPGFAYLRLLEVIKRINPEPDDLSSWRDMTVGDRMSLMLKTSMNERPYTWVMYAAYGVISTRHSYNAVPVTKEQLVELFSALKRDLKRVYETLRQEISTTRLRLQILDNYKVRSEWYNHLHLRGLIDSKADRKNRNDEEILTRDLALYLYDQGFVTLHRLRVGKHEPDLTQFGVDDPMVIEAKVYRDSTGKKSVIDGVAQLHSYLTNLEGYGPVSEGFYLVFRLGGPIYELPREVPTNRFMIRTILIDLGASIESGRKQPKPVVISLGDVMEAIEKKHQGAK